jgi:hypothetical protein
VANGAVLYTASHAALLGYNVIVPVDVIAAENPYTEQYVVWNFTSAQLVAPNVKLTSSDRLSYERPGLSATGLMISAALNDDAKKPYLARASMSGWKFRTSKYSGSTMRTLWATTSGAIPV